MYWAYHALGVAPGCLRSEARRSYRRLLKVYHPDMLRHRGLSQQGIQQELIKFHEIQRAWEMLRESLPQ